MLIRRLWAWLLLVVVYAAITAAADAHASFHYSVTVDLGADLGQDFGSLFEVMRADGTVVAGAGFLSAYNTYYRSDRHRLHFYVRAPEVAPHLQALPNPSTDTGVYLFDVDGKLYARSSSGGMDKQTRVWSPGSERWESVDVHPATRVGKALLEFRPDGPYYEGRTVLAALPQGTSVSSFYYAHGVLFFRVTGESNDVEPARLYACPWTPELVSAELSDATSVKLTTPTEFPYSYGQFGQEVLVATNLGGVHRFRRGEWETLRTPEPKVSHQIYSMLRYRDRLLMGHYPTGYLFEYAGETLTLLEGAPPVMEGVSSSAREAQTLSLYGGDVYAGVWPWAECWRLDDNTKEWHLVRRMFSHPEITAETVHPYEQETTAAGAVLNLWGQRLTSLVPLGNSLYISTSSKGGQACEPEFTFLEPQQAAEYGRVYEYTLPGHLGAGIQWKNGPTTFDFLVAGKSLSVRQDGQMLAKGHISEARLPDGEYHVTWGNGVYGPFTGEIVATDADTGSTR